MLPPPEGTTVKDSADGRAEQPIREIAVRTMLQASALAQTRRSAHDRTTHDYNYQKGDMVDYHRPAAEKDASGWHGPVLAINMPQNKRIIARIYNREVPCKYQDVRFSLLIALMFHLGKPNVDSAEDFWTMVHRCISRLTPGASKLFGQTFEYTRSRVTTEATRKEPRMAQATHHLVQNIMTVDMFRCVRVGRGLKRLRAMTGIEHHFLAHWHDQDVNDYEIVELPNVDIDVSTVIETNLDHRLMMVINIVSYGDDYPIALNETSASQSLQTDANEHHNDDHL